MPTRDEVIQKQHRFELCLATKPNVTHVSATFVVPSPVTPLFVKIKETPSSLFSHDTFDIPEGLIPPSTDSELITNRTLSLIDMLNNDIPVRIFFHELRQKSDNTGPVDDTHLQYYLKKYPHLSLVRISKEIYDGAIAAGVSAATYDYTIEGKQESFVVSANQVNQPPSVSDSYRAEIDNAAGARTAAFVQETLERLERLKYLSFTSSGL